MDEGRLHRPHVDEGALHEDQLGLTGFRLCVTQGSLFDANPGVRGHLVDLEETAAGAREVLRRFGDRAEVTGGSFFGPLPIGGLTEFQELAAAHGLALVGATRVTDGRSLLEFCKHPI
ncbi:hypothetical protein [Lentzea sp. NPDC004782]|uniref:hypothetical protein n=1 Tax=Lentzea sp. NPDC004782 TaxID=3154458 RepID=UPI0033B2B582